mmetsp:Transcript_18742/g.26344  ORF Transcript_18742/g.26344 Transcript_18742/m.26344 type:complete len:82 (-) Transcript_18742:139-384(-)
MSAQNTCSNDAHFYFTFPGVAWWTSVYDCTEAGCTEEVAQLRAMSVPPRKGRGVRSDGSKSAQQLHKEQMILNCWFMKMES